MENNILSAADFFRKFPVGAYVFYNGNLLGKIVAACQTSHYQIIVKNEAGDYVTLPHVEDGYFAKRKCERAGCNRFIDVSQTRCEEHQQEFNNVCDSYRRMRASCTDDKSLQDGINKFRSGTWPDKDDTIVNR